MDLAKHLCAALFGLTLLPAAAGNNVLCAIDKNTDARKCIDPTEVRERDGIRFAPLYTGGPNRVRKTNFTVHANCTQKILHIKDMDGVSFGGGFFSATPTSAALGKSLCEAVIKKK